MVSRTLLVKGLELDHVVIADVNTVADQWMFYVAMSRARKSITVLGSSPRFVLKATPLRLADDQPLTHRPPQARSRPRWPCRAAHNKFTDQNPGHLVSSREIVPRVI
jgi:hypothetical protein